MMQRVYFSANPNPDSFWNSTFEEVSLVIQGQVDKWRIERRNAYNIHCSLVEKPVSITDFTPLPYDDEFEGSTELNDEQLYNLAIAEGKVGKVITLNKVG